MGKQIAVLALAAFAAPTAFSQIYGGSGKCTVEVEVDSAADVLVSGSRAQVRTLHGGRAYVVRTNCNTPMPAFPADLRFRGIDGRGRQTLLADPASNRGTAVVRIEDPRGGRERYTFDLIWNGNGGYNSGGYGYPNGGYPVYGGNYPNNYPNNYPVYGNYPNNYPVYGNNGNGNGNGRGRNKNRRQPRGYDRWGNPRW